MMPLIDAQHSFYEGLTAYHFARQHPNENDEWMNLGERAICDYRMLASHSTWNWENKLFLLEAERHVCKGELDEAESKYIAAIESAHNHRFVHEAGLANELLSAFFTKNAKFDKAKHHLSEARACYEKWGAYAILDRLSPSDAA